MSWQADIREAKIKRRAIVKSVEDESMRSKSENGGQLERVNEGICSMKDSAWSKITPRSLTKVEKTKIGNSFERQTIVKIG